MKSRRSILCALLDGVLIRAWVQVIFFGVEQLGEIGDVCLEFVGRRSIVLGCAGDGGVFVRPARLANRGTAPNTATTERELTDLAGRLLSFEVRQNDLRFQFECGSLRVTNIDDELMVLVNGQEVPGEFLLRE